MPYLSSGYLYHSFQKEDFWQAIERAIDTLRDYDSRTPFDGLVFTGMSGASMGFTVAHALGKKPILIRKDADDCHFSKSIQGQGDSPERLVFFDDCIESGCTFDHVKHVLDVNLPFAKIVALYLYNDYRRLWDDLPIIRKQS